MIQYLGICSRIPITWGWKVVGSGNGTDETHLARILLIVGRKVIEAYYFLLCNIYRNALSKFSQLEKYRWQNTPDQLYQTGNMLFINKNMALDVELQVMLGSEKAIGEDRLSLDSLKFYLPLEHRLNLTFRWNQHETVLKPDA